MLVNFLEIDNFRNLRQLTLPCSPGLNLIVGANASGKTSLLEALYFLGRARSFRSRQVRELIHRDASTFRIVAKVSATPDGRHIPVGIERNARDMNIRIDGAPVRSLAPLAMHVPVLLLNTDSHRLLEGGPQQRRRFMDWGLFHADNAFLSAWRRYSTALRNRNAALRTQAVNRMVDAWDEELAAAAGTLDRLRQGFCEALEGVLEPLVGKTLGNLALQVEYRRGWPPGAAQGLVGLLRNSRDQDRRYGYTRLGPHRADFTLRLAGRAASAQLSRGQEKLLVIALVLAQAQLYRIHKGSPAILLIDDLPAELDQRHRDRVMACLAAMDTQLFVTAIEAGLLDIAAWQNARAFKIEGGNINEMV